MGRIGSALEEYARIGLDTSIFIYHFEAHPVYLPLTTELFSLIESGQKGGITSTITLLEILVRPLKLNQPEIARKIETLLFNFPNLSIVDLNRDVIRDAARLRAEYGLRTPDALQAAAVRTYGGNVFVTNDRRLQHLNPWLPIIFLDDFTGNS